MVLLTSFDLWAIVLAASARHAVISTGEARNLPIIVGYTYYCLVSCQSSLLCFRVAFSYCGGNRVNLAPRYCACVPVLALASASELALSFKQLGSRPWLRGVPVVTVGTPLRVVILT